MRTLTLVEFETELRSQGVPIEEIRFVCPMCRVPQSAKDLIAAGAGATLDDVERYLAFSCVGRWRGAASPRAAPDGNPCDWTLGGLFRTHQLEVVTPDGVKHPRFEFERLLAPVVPA